MTQQMVFIAGQTPALQNTKGYLQHLGIPVTKEAGLHISDLLLDVPSLRPGGLTKEALDTLLSALPRDVTVWGGNIHIEGYRCVDLLQDEGYLWENAAITARCALTLAAPLLKRAWKDISVLILGWGRIGTYLGKLLREQGASVTIAARKETHRLRLKALDYRAVDFQSTGKGYDLVINTVPLPLFHQADFENAAILLDLASQQGIAGDRVLWARGLPGIHAPEESGKLIAKTFLRLKKGDVQ